MKERGVVISIAGLAIVLAVQLGGFVWWAATLSSDVRHLTVGFIAMQAVQYTKPEADKDFRNVADRHSDLERRVTTIEKKTVRP